MTERRFIVGGLTSQVWTQHDNAKDAWHQMHSISRAKRRMGWDSQTYMELVFSAAKHTKRFVWGYRAYGPPADLDSKRWARNRWDMANA